MYGDLERELEKRFDYEFVSRTKKRYNYVSRRAEKYSRKRLLS